MRRAITATRWPRTRVHQARGSDEATRRAIRALRARRTKPARGTRLVVLVITFAVLSLMVTGEHWMLEHPATASNELIAATCVVDAVFGAAGAADTVCTATRESTDKEDRL